MLPLWIRYDNWRWGAQQRFTLRGQVDHVLKRYRTRQVFRAIYFRAC
jgi:hypothetical protein